MMDYEGNCLRLQAVAFYLLGFGLTLTLMVFYQAADFNSETFLEKSNFGDGTVNVAPQELSPFQYFAPLLKRLAADDRTILLTTVNGSWAEPDSLLDVFLQSFQTGEKIDHFLKHLLILAFDSQSFERCKLVHPYCYYQHNVDENSTAPVPQGFMSKGYLDLVCRKAELQRYIEGHTTKICIKNVAKEMINPVSKCSEMVISKQICTNLKTTFSTKIIPIPMGSSEGLFLAWLNECYLREVFDWWKSMNIRQKSIIQ